jgi:hypothetical protein
LDYSSTDNNHGGIIVALMLDLDAIHRSANRFIQRRWKHGSADTLFVLREANNLPAGAASTIAKRIVAKRRRMPTKGWIWKN